MKETYVRCPRCELNYILKKDKYCEVCKQELKLTKAKEPEEFEEDLELCPICKINYLQEDEVMCPSCAKEKEMENGLYTDNDQDSDWEEFIENNDAILDNEELGEMISITEGEDDDDDEDDGDENSDDEFEDDDFDDEFEDDDFDDEDDENDEFDDEDDE